MRVSLNVASGNTLLAFFLVIAFMSPFIEKIGVIQVSIALLTVFLVLQIISYFILNGLRVSDQPYMIFLAYLFMSCFVSLIYGNQLYDVVRSLIPFLYLPVFYFISSRLSKKYIRYVVFVLLGTGIGTAIFVFPFMVETASKGVFSNSRFTAYIDNSHLPIMLASIPLLFYFKINIYLKYILLIVLMLAIFATKSKGQILFSVMILYFALLASHGVNGRSFVKHMRLVLLIVVVVSLSFFVFKDGIFKRLGSDAISGNTTSHRVEEISVGWNVFVSSPIFGQGPGMVFDIVGTNTEDKTEQRFVHNVVIYFLATGGLVGFLAYFSLYGSILMNVKALFRSRESRLFLLSIFSIFLYSLVSASFKSIQANCYLGFFLGGLYCLRKDSFNAEKNRINHD